MNNKNWLSDLIVRLFNFLKDITYKPVQMPEEEPVITPDPEPVETPIEKLKPMPLTPSERLYNIAKSQLGVDASPRDLADDELACAETVNTLYEKAFGHKICVPGLSTTQLYKEMSANTGKFRKIILSRNSPTKKGWIIISPTNYGNGRLANGHTGIIGNYGILSNDSESGLLKENYTLNSWFDRYYNIGGFPVIAFEPI